MARYINADREIQMLKESDHPNAEWMIEELSNVPTAINIEEILDNLDEIRTEYYDEENDEAVKAVDACIIAVKAGECI